MAEIIVSDEQVRTILAADDFVSVKDAAGNVIAYISPPITRENVWHLNQLIAGREQKQVQEFRTTDQVFDRLRKLGQDQLDGRSEAQRRLSCEESRGDTGSSKRNMGS